MQKFNRHYIYYIQNFMLMLGYLKLMLETLKFYYFSMMFNTTAFTFLILHTNNMTRTYVLNFSLNDRKNYKIVRKKIVNTFRPVTIIFIIYENKSHTIIAFGYSLIVAFDHSWKEWKISWNETQTYEHQ